MTTTELKRLAQMLFEEMTGVKPSMKQIALLEADTENELATYLYFATGWKTENQHEWIWHAGRDLEEYEN